MNFNQICNLILEAKKIVLGEVFLSHFSYYIINTEDKKESIKAVVDYLQKNGLVDSGSAVIAERVSRRSGEEYLLLLHRSMTARQRKKITKNLEPYINEYLWGPSASWLSSQEAVVYKCNYGSMEWYNIDQETKDTWRGILDEL